MANRAIAHFHSIVRITWLGAEVSCSQAQLGQIHRLINLRGIQDRAMSKTRREEAEIATIKTITALNGPRKNFRSMPLNTISP